MQDEIQVIIRNGRQVEFEFKAPRPSKTPAKDEVVYYQMLKCVVEYVDKDTIGLQKVINP
ncbi:hypothetical protein [Aeromonas veronii]|uniref:hypothetical protein n=1 Tax=Aeromonas veronii TaxID=654 RepID=UPI003D1C7FDA